MNKLYLNFTIYNSTINATICDVLSFIALLRNIVISKSYPILFTMFILIKHAIHSTIDYLFKTCFCNVLLLLNVIWKEIVTESLIRLLVFDYKIKMLRLICIETSSCRMILHFLLSRQISFEVDET